MAFPSSFGDIQNAVLAKSRLDPVLDGQRVKDWINQSYTRVCVETEAMIRTATMTVTAGASTYLLPAGVARIKQMLLQPAGQTQSSPPLIRTTLDEILSRRQAGGDQRQSGNQATHYAVLGINQFELWPTPAAADVIWIWYVLFPASLSAPTDVPILEEPYASKLLEYGALTDAGDFNGDPSALDWENNFNEWMGRYQQHLDRKQGVIPGQFHQWGDTWVPAGYDPADVYG
jgi:hypothetical protein